MLAMIRRIAAASAVALIVTAPVPAAAEALLCRSAEPPEEMSVAQQIIRLFNAKGVHTCQSRTAIGHSCEVRGQYTSCLDAGHSLKLQDCCAGTGHGGRSIGFFLAGCSQYTFPR